MVQADGKILVGGNFTQHRWTDAQSHRPARWHHRPGRFIQPERERSCPFTIAVQADGKILAGGTFTSIGGQARNVFARLTNDTAALQNLAVTQTTITWTRGGSSPQFTRVTFEYSTDNVNYTPLGNGTAAGNNWTLTGLNLPTGQNFYIRARGYYRAAGPAARRASRNRSAMPFSSGQQTLSPEKCMEARALSISISPLPVLPAWNAGVAEQPASIS